MAQTVTHHGHTIRVENSRKATIVAVEGDLGVLVPPDPGAPLRDRQPARFGIKLVKELGGSHKEQPTNSRVVFKIKKCSIRAALSIVKAKIDGLLSRVRRFGRQLETMTTQPRKERSRPVRRQVPPATATG